VRQFAELRERVTRLEGRVDDVQEEVAAWRATLNGHTQTLNAMREDLDKHGKKLDKVEKEMHAGFAKLAKGQELITDLLTRHLGEPDEESGVGGADE
jgi:uncharacterized coiled-coil DUF342 family protein